MYHTLVFYICFDKNCNTYKLLNFFRNMFNNSKAIKIYCCIICNILHMPHPFFQVNHFFNKHSQIWVHFDIFVFQISQWIRVALKSHNSLTSLCQCLLLFALNLLTFFFFFSIWVFFIAPLPNIFSNKLPPNVPKNILRNQSSCYFIIKPESSRTLTTFMIYLLFLLLKSTTNPSSVINAVVFRTKSNRDKVAVMDVLSQEFLF